MVGMQSRVLLALTLGVLLGVTTVAAAPPAAARQGSGRAMLRP